MYVVFNQEMDRPHCKINHICCGTENSMLNFLFHRVLGVNFTLAGNKLDIVLVKKLFHFFFQNISWLGRDQSFVFSNDCLLTQLM